MQLYVKIDVCEQPKILKQELQMYSYRIQVKQQLSYNDKQLCVTMCEWFEEEMRRDPNFN